MNITHKYLPHYTYDDYIQWEGHWELIDGIPYAMAPMPVPKHQWIAGNLHAEFRAAIKESGCACKVYQPIDYKLSDDTIFNPDLLISCKPITKKFLDFAPDLVVEILSESTGLKDRNIKFPKYETEGIRYYLLVDADKGTIEVNQLINEKYQKQALDQSQPFEFVLGDCRVEMLFHQIWE